jgi:hypothetical protein
MLVQLYPQELSPDTEPMLQPTVSWPVCLGVGHPSGVHDQIFYTVEQLQVSWSAISSDERMGL